MCQPWVDELVELLAEALVIKEELQRQSCMTPDPRAKGLSEKLEPLAKKYPEIDAGFHAAKELIGQGPAGNFDVEEVNRITKVGVKRVRLLKRVERYRSIRPRSSPNRALQPIGWVGAARRKAWRFGFSSIQITTSPRRWSQSTAS